MLIPHRFADPLPTPDPATTPRMPGSNQSGMREFNERVVLHAIRLHGSLPKAELARLTNLSTQTVSVIINHLLDEGFVVKRDSLRGRVGQPSQPIALNPEGAFSIGVQIGRRNLDVALIDFTGAPRYRKSIVYGAPSVDAVFGEIGEHLERIEDQLGIEKMRRVSGIGLAAPLAFGGWRELVGLSPQDADAWTRTNMRERLQGMTRLPVAFAKDTAAACVAELVAGRGRHLKNYLYVFVDTLLGGGLVLNGQPHAGVYGNAGAIGSMALGVADPTRPGGMQQLLAVASLARLEEMLAAVGLEHLPAGDARLLQAPWAPVTRRWVDEAASAIAFSINTSSCLLDLDGVIVDGALGAALLDSLINAVRAALGQYSWQGIMRPEIIPGAIGRDAKVIGAAYLPLHANFAPGHESFLKPGRG
ncbi:MAG: serine/threonine protein kinase [Candidatus Accumulibacter sp.]|nr:serine/threonine protein kinase [Accumulibacter sp.]